MPPKGKNFKQHPLANSAKKKAKKQQDDDDLDALLDQLSANNETIRKQEAEAAKVQPAKKESFATNLSLESTFKKKRNKKYPAEGVESQNHPMAAVQAARIAARERVLYAAAHKCFKVYALPDSFHPESEQVLGAPCRKQSSQEPTREQMEAAKILDNQDIKNWESQISPGSMLLVEWNDPRSDSEVWQPAGPKCGQSAPFAFWDGPSLALELHAMTMKVEGDDEDDDEDEDEERVGNLDVVRGSLLYTAATMKVALKEDEEFSSKLARETSGPSWILWNMAFHYHASNGKAFPSPSSLSLAQNGLFYQEMSRLTQMEYDRASGDDERNKLPAAFRLKHLPLAPRDTDLISLRPENFKQGMGTETLWLAIQEYMRFYIEGFFLGSSPPESTKPDAKLYPWHAAQEELWSGLLKRYIEEKIAPCMHMADGYCYRGALCRADHRRTTPAFEKVMDLFYEDIEDPVETEANAVQPAPGDASSEIEDVKKFLNEAYPEGGYTEFNRLMKIPSLMMRGMIAQVVKRVLRYEAETNSNREVHKLKGKKIVVISNLSPGHAPDVSVGVPTQPSSSSRIRPHPQFDHITRVTNQSVRNPDFLEALPRVAKPLQLVFQYHLNITAETKKLPPKPKRPVVPKKNNNPLTTLFKGSVNPETNRQPVVMGRGIGITNVREEVFYDDNGDPIGGPVMSFSLGA